MIGGRENVIHVFFYFCLRGVNFNQIEVYRNSTPVASKNAVQADLGALGFARYSDAERKYIPLIIFINCRFFNELLATLTALFIHKYFIQGVFGQVSIWDRLDSEFATQKQAEIDRILKDNERK